jgi:hypothetical protein
MRRRINFIRDPRIYFAIFVHYYAVVYQTRGIENTSAILRVGPKHRTALDSGAMLAGVILRSVVVYIGYFDGGPVKQFANRREIGSRPSTGRAAFEKGDRQVPPRTAATRRPDGIESASGASLSLIAPTLIVAGCVLPICSNDRTEVNRRTRLARPLANEASLLRLAAAILMETSDDCQ